ncbi:MAG TPA: condensation domain-containing protein, partial [Kouleothrix sp.]|nr:condensation domain-containing protein [Kouleothrix sp.]
AGAAVAPLPRDFAAGDELNTEASARSVTLALDADETRALLQDVPEVYRTQISHALLAALAQACAAWSGAPVLLADVEGHGRAVPFNEIDLSRTVGWFTAIFPALIDIGQASDPGALLRAAKEQLLRVPNDGAGYGVLRYLNDQAGAELRALPQAEISFNYLGQLDQTLAGAALFGLAHEPTGPAESPRGRRRYLIDVRAMVVGGRLQAEWVYSAQLHQHATIERLAQGFLAALRAIIAHCRQPDAGGYTPADFLDVELSQEQLEHALAEIDFDQEEDDA